MNLKMTKIMTIPEAENVIKAFRAEGRSYKQAFSEFIDNSIDAQASFVEIQINREGSTYSARIIDDGIGMDNPMLIKALSLGTSTEKKELSEFGIGMKVAAMSMFDNIEIATKTENGPVLIGRQNFSEMSSENSFEAFIGTVDDSTYVHPVERGTVIDLSHDRRNFPSANWVNNLKIYLSQIFRYYISEKGFTIIVNGNELVSLDPLDIPDAELESWEHSFDNIEAENGNEYTGNINVKISILKEGKSFKSRNGLYVVRNDREIQSGGNMVSISGNKLAFPKNVRIELSYYTALDPLIQVGTQKDTALFSHAFYTYIKSFLSSYVPAGTIKSVPVSKQTDFIKQEKKKKDALPKKLKDIIDASKILNVPIVGKTTTLFVVVMDDSGLRVEVNTDHPKWKHK